MVQGIRSRSLLLVCFLDFALGTMAPMKAMKSMKAMKASAKAMSKGEMVKMIAAEHDMKPKECSQVLDSLAATAAAEVKKTGIFTIPGVARIKTRVKPARKAGVRVMFGVEKKA